MMTLAGQDISDADMILVDGKNTLWRAAHALASLGYKGKDGLFRQTGALFGFFESVLAVAHRAKDADIYICWEGSRDNRRAIVDSYKVHRDKPDPRREAMFKQVIKQEATLRHILSHSSWRQAKSRNWEADDTMATLAAAGRRAGKNVVIYTNDFDLMQCLYESEDDPDDSEQWVRQYSVVKRKGVTTTDFVWTDQRLFTERGVWPWQVPHLKALAGDQSDGYKGVPGVGEKTAVGWLNDGGAGHDLTSVIDRIITGKITGSKAQAVIKHTDDARACYEVAVANDKVKVKFVDGEPDANEIRRLFHGLRFQSLANARAIDRLTR